MKIISFKICPFVQRVTALLEMKGAAYDVEYIDLNNKPRWFLEASPNGQVPILITDEGQVLFESDAIVEYIDEVVGEPLFARDPMKKAQERAWSYLASKHYLVQCSTQRSSDEITLAERSTKFNTAFAKIQTQLGDAPFIGGDSMGMVDIAWTTLLHRTEIIKRRSGYDFLADFPRLKAWRATVMSTGIPAASVSEDFEDRFSAFYLADTTYLGQLAMAQNSELRH
ncbi:MAG: glutathione S-transferase family protein [Cyanobacteria bacterium P01_E01_bin.6]